MRIAFISGFALSPKGTVRARTLPIAAELTKQGHEVTVFLTPYDNLADVGHQWEHDGVHIRNIPCGSSVPTQHSHSKYLLYAGMLRQLMRQVNRYSPHLVHIFKPKGFAGAAGSYFLLRKSFPVVVDCDDWEGWGGWNEVKPYPWLVKEYIDRQERWMMRSAGAVTVASRVLQERAAAARGSSNGTYYVPNCASATNTSDQCAARDNTRDPLSLPQGLIVLYSGHFEPIEDPLFLCRASINILKKHHASLIIVGDGPQLADVRQFFSQYPEVNVLYFSQLPYSRFCDYVRAADVTVFPYPNDNVHRAKCSARIVDYMSMKKPVLTSAVGQNQEYIIDGESGLLARPADEHDFATKLDLLLSNRDLRLRLADNAAQRIYEHFRWDGNALTQCLAAYDRALGRP